MSGATPLSPKRQFFSAVGAPLSGGKLYVYAAGTTTPITTWQDQAESTPNTNPITLDSRGECLMWVDSSAVYKEVLFDAAGNMIYSADNLSGMNSAAVLAAASYASGFKNRLINGNMLVNQRTQGLATGNAIYPVDRWAFTHVVATSGQGQASVTNNIPSPSGGVYIELSCTTAKPSLNSTDVENIIQVIEGVNVRDLQWGTANAKPVTVQLWAYGTPGFVLPLSFRNSANNRSYVTTITLTAVPVLYTVTIPGDSAGTWLSAVKTVGIYVAITFAAGSSFVTGTPNAWTNGQFVTAAGATNGLAAVSNIARVSDIQLEKGSVATSYESRSFSYEQFLCMRYYEKSYDYGTIPGSAVQPGCEQWAVPATTVVAAGGVLVRYKVPKMVPGTVRMISAAGTLNFISDFANSTTRACTIGSQGENGFLAFATWVVASNGFNAGLHWDCNSDFF